jgi:hypothetical protein
MGGFVSSPTALFSSRHYENNSVIEALSWMLLCAHYLSSTTHPNGLVVERGNGNDQRLVKTIMAWSDVHEW